MVGARQHVAAADFHAAGVGEHRHGRAVEHGPGGVAELGHHRRRACRQLHGHLRRGRVAEGAVLPLALEVYEVPVARHPRAVARGGVLRDCHRRGSHRAVEVAPRHLRLGLERVRHRSRAGRAVFPVGSGLDLVGRQFHRQRVAVNRGRHHNRCLVGGHGRERHRARCRHRGEDAGGRLHGVRHAARQQLHATVDVHVRHRVGTRHRPRRVALHRRHLALGHQAVHAHRLPQPLHLVADEGVDVLAAYGRCNGYFAVDGQRSVLVVEVLLRTRGPEAEVDLVRVGVLAERNHGLPRQREAVDARVHVYARRVGIDGGEYHGGLPLGTVGPLRQSPVAELADVVAGLRYVAAALAVVLGEVDVAVVVAAVVGVCVVVHGKHEPPVAVVAHLVGRACLGVEHLGYRLVPGHHHGLGLLAVLFGEEVAAVCLFGLSVDRHERLLDPCADYAAAGGDVLLAGENVGLDDGQRLEEGADAHIEPRHLGEGVAVAVDTDDAPRRAGLVPAHLESLGAAHLVLRVVVLELGEEAGTTVSVNKRTYLRSGIATLPTPDGKRVDLILHLVETAHGFLLFQHYLVCRYLVRAFLDSEAVDKHRSVYI